MTTVVRSMLRWILLAGLTLLPLACRTECPDPIREQLFLLNARVDGQLGDAGVGPGAWDDGCAQAADRCIAGGECERACTCVLDHNDIQYSDIQVCALNPEPGPPAVFVRYAEVRHCR
jgi:hypothetical protein